MRQSSLFCMQAVVLLVAKFLQSICARDVVGGQFLYCLSAASWPSNLSRVCLGVRVFGGGKLSRRSFS